MTVLGVYARCASAEAPACSISDRFLRSYYLSLLHHKTFCNGLRTLDLEGDTCASPETWLPPNLLSKPLQKRETTSSTLIGSKATGGAALDFQSEQDPLTSSTFVDARLQLNLPLIHPNPGCSRIQKLNHIADRGSQNPLE